VPKNDAFNWNDETLAFPTVQAVAVYLNAAGEVVIRQQDPMGDEDDVIVFPVRHIDDVILSLENLKQSRGGAK
jgi:hypothetical protein